jgi:hypothetical protein
VAALEVGGELDLVDRQEGGVGGRRHRLDGAHLEAWILRDDLFFAGDQRDLVGADAGSDLGVDLARQKAERQPDDAAAMGEHALDGEVGLAGVGRPEDRNDVAGPCRAFGSVRDGHRMRKIAFTVGRPAGQAGGGLAVSRRDSRIADFLPKTVDFSRPN